MDTLDRKTPLPSGQLDYAIMGGSTPHVFHLRRQRDHFTGVHRRHVGDAKSRLMLLKFALDLADKSIQRENTRATDEEYDKEGDQQ